VRARESEEVSGAEGLFPRGHDDDARFSLEREHGGSRDAAQLEVAKRLPDGVAFGSEPHGNEFSESGQEYFDRVEGIRSRSLFAIRPLGLERGEHEQDDAELGEDAHHPSSTTKGTGM
jgi:hypothetical protein